MRFRSVGEVEPDHQAVVFGLIAPGSAGVRVVDVAQAAASARMLVHSIKAGTLTDSTG